MALVAAVRVRMATAMVAKNLPQNRFRIVAQQPLGESSAIGFEAKARGVLIEQLLFRSDCVMEERRRTCRPSRLCQAFLASETSSRTCCTCRAGGVRRTARHSTLAYEGPSWQASAEPQDCPRADFRPWNRHANWQAVPSLVSIGGCWSTGLATCPGDDSLPKTSNLDPWMTCTCTSHVSSIS